MLLFLCNEELIDLSLPIDSSFKINLQINVLPPQTLPFIPNIISDRNFADGRVEHSSGISSSIDIISPAQQTKWPSGLPSESRYVGMVSEITNNDIHQRLQPSMQWQQQQQQQRQQPGLPPFLLGTSPEVQQKVCTRILFTLFPHSTVLPKSEGIRLSDTLWGNHLTLSFSEFFLHTGLVP